MPNESRKTIDDIQAAIDKTYASFCYDANRTVGLIGTNLADRVYLVPTIRREGNVITFYCTIEEYLYIKPRHPAAIYSMELTLHRKTLVSELARAEKQAPKNLFAAIGARFLREVLAQLHLA